MIVTQYWMLLNSGLELMKLVRDEVLFQLKTQPLGIATFPNHDFNLPAKTR